MISPLQDLKADLQKAGAERAEMWLNPPKKKAPKYEFILSPFAREMATQNERLRRQMIADQVYREFRHYDRPGRFIGVNGTTT